MLRICFIDVLKQSLNKPGIKEKSMAGRIVLRNLTVCFLPVNQEIPALNLIICLAHFVPLMH